MNVRLAPAAPAPGSRLAARHGCTCSPQFNNHGAGIPGDVARVDELGLAHRVSRPVYVVALSCPLHGAMDWRDVDMTDGVPPWGDDHGEDVGKI